MMETHEFSFGFQMGGLQVAPVHVRVERLSPVIAAHRHSNVSYEIHYTRSGRGDVTIDGVTRGVYADTLYVTGPGVEHAQRSDPGDPIVEYCLYLNCWLLPGQGSRPFARFAQTHFWMGEDGGRVYPLLERLLDECRQSQPGAREMIETLLRAVIILLNRMYHSEPPRAGHAEAPAITRAGLMPIIEDAFFYRHRSLTLDQLAALLNLSVRQTQRLLTASFGKTFSQKLTDARMAAASQFLQFTDLSVTEIADRTGFCSIEHFSAAFKRHMGCSPRAYRKRSREGGKEMRSEE